MLKKEDTESNYECQNQNFSSTQQDNGKSIFKNIFKSLNLILTLL